MFMMREILPANNLARDWVDVDGDILLVTRHTGKATNIVVDVVGQIEMASSSSGKKNQRNFSLKCCMER